MSASEWFKQQPGRFVMWHVKDMHKTSRDYTELGNGTVDFSQIFPHARLAGLQHYFVEQGGNFTHDVPQHRRRAGVHEAHADPEVRRRRVLRRRHLPGDRGPTMASAAFRRLLKSAVPVGAK